MRKGEERWEMGEERREMGEERWEKEKKKKRKRKRKDFPPGIPQQKVSLLLFRF